MKNVGTTIQLEAKLEKITIQADEEHQDPRRILTREEAYGVRDCFHVLMEMEQLRESKYFDLLIQIFGSEEALMVEVRTIANNPYSVTQQPAWKQCWKLETEPLSATAV